MKNTILKNKFNLIIFIVTFFLLNVNVLYIYIYKLIENNYALPYSLAYDLQIMNLYEDKNTLFFLTFLSYLFLSLLSYFLHKFLWKKLKVEIYSIDILIMNFVLDLISFLVSITFTNYLVFSFYSNSMVNLNVFIFVKTFVYYICYLVSIKSYGSFRKIKIPNKAMLLLILTRSIFFL
ncbi:MAG: hypothetical protein ACRCZK_03905 [Oscillospiraceae bacterium]